jgi:C-terminal processing protease CtpA/Prc
MRGAHGYKLVLVFCCLIFGVSVMAQKKLAEAPKIPPALLIKDLQTLQKVIEQNHPSTYWYTPKDSMDYYFSSALASVKDSMSAWAFKNVVATYLANIKCGHTSVHFSPKLTKQYANYRFPQFPLQIKVWKDSAVVIGNLFTKDSILKRGTIVTAINQMPVKPLVDSLYSIISTDGYSINFKSQVLTNNFAGWYKAKFGDVDSVYQISYIDSAGNASTTSIAAYVPPKPKKDSVSKLTVASSKPKKPKPVPPKKWTLLVDSATNTAFMNLSSFSGSGLRKFIRQSFRTIKTRSVKNLVIDIRSNGGGNIKNSTLLSRYISDHSFKIADSVVANNRGIGKVPLTSFFSVMYYALAKSVISKKEADGKFHFKRFEKHYYAPVTKNHFDGNVYILQGGYTFSASTLFTSPLMKQKNVTIVGEESGGGYYGNTAMMIPNIKLPNSGLLFRLPLYRLVMDKTRPKGNGVIPHVMVDPSSYAIKQGFDIKLEAVKKMIQQKN